MSEALTATDWAEPEVMARYREDVAKAASDWLSMHPNAKRRTEIRAPEKAAHALYLLNETDIPKYKIETIVGLPGVDLGRLMFHRPEIWEKRRPRLAAELAGTAEQLVDLMQDKIASLKADPSKLDEEGLKDIALSIGIVTDKAATFNGMATAVVEHRSGPSIDDARQAIEDAKARAAAKLKSFSQEAEIISHVAVEGTPDSQAAE